jgi:hypothetical protein
MLLALSNAATTGLFALGGVLIGALSSAAIQGVFEWRRGRGDLRQAKRLVAGELVRVATHFDGLVREGKTPRTLGGESRFMPDAAWLEHRAVLARYLGNDDIFVLSSFMESLPTTRDLLATLPPDYPLPAELRRRAERGRELAIECYRILAAQDLDLLLDELATAPRTAPRPIGKDEE